MFETGLIEQVLRIINSNYSNIYVIDVVEDKVYSFNFTVTNSLVIKDTMTYTDFIEVAKMFVHKKELSSYFEALSLNKLELESQKGNNETKVKYRKLCETGEYRWFVNIINYLPFNGKKLIFMMSEDINERLVDSEENNLLLKQEVTRMNKKINQDNENISNMIYQINNLFENDVNNELIKNKDIKEFINSLFNRLSIDNPELKNALNLKLSINNVRKTSILIVDDSSIIRNSLKRIFSNDYNIIYAKNGKEAIDILNNNALNQSINEEKDVIVGVLLDLVMPESDGFDVLEYMKKYNLLSKIPVAIISGDETRETRKKVYQYDIVDMLEKPFNTETIRKRITNIINLYRTSGNLVNLVDLQNKELKNNVDNFAFEELKMIIEQIVNKVLNANESIRLKKIVQIIANSLNTKFPEYGLDSKYIDYIVDNCALYNIGAIAMKDNLVITGNSIKQEISYGMTIVENVIEDSKSKKIAKNIIKYSCEMFNGNGYPNNIKGNDIPIEAQITNLAVRLNQQTGEKSMQTLIKQLTTTDANKYNPDLIDALKNCKKELKSI